MTDLLDAVDALTRPVKRIVDQGTSKGTVTDVPLIVWLERSIRATIGIGGSGSLPNERNMLDAEALYQFSKISSIIKDWARSAGVEYERETSTSELLRKWFVKFYVSDPSDKSVSHHVKMLSKWAWQIEAKMDPPKIRQLPDPCPLCGADAWWKGGVEYTRPLVVHYREGPEMIEQAKGMCQACATVWGVTELGGLLGYDTPTHQSVDVVAKIA